MTGECAGVSGEGIADGGAAGVPQSHFAIHVAGDDPVPALGERRDGGIKINQGQCVVLMSPF